MTICRVAASSRSSAACRLTPCDTTTCAHLPELDHGSRRYCGRRLYDWLASRKILGNRDVKITFVLEQSQAHEDLRRVGAVDRGSVNYNLGLDELAVRLDDPDSVTRKLVRCVDEGDGVALDEHV